MTFDDGLRKVQSKLKSAGYSSVIRPVNISELDKETAVQNCKIIAKKDQYEIMYLEATSNWKSIATNLAQKHKLPCLIITSYGSTHLILSTILDVMTKPRPRHLVIDLRSKSYSLDDFVQIIRMGSQEEDFISIDKKVQTAFDKFSNYKQALDEFDNNLDAAIRSTRNLIVKRSKNNKQYDSESVDFLRMCKAIISDKMEIDDVVELLLQHVMTYRIFALLYDEHELHTTNAVARSMENLVKTLEINTEEITIKYRTVELVAESITDAAEKQDFLKLVYETFYTKYDPKNKDKWGIAYTPSEVVDFMARSSDHLLKKHFGKSLSDKRVTILDPATGTGTFITSILRHLNPVSIDEKYHNEIFANDISILAYYIAALNIENTYQEITGKIKEFENICWMDTLASGAKDFGKMTSYLDGQDNVRRISRQQKTNICVILGNPPYDAVQASFNDTNPAEKYPEIDQQIAETFIKQSKTSNKHKQYDMYKRFFKWSSERIKNNGIIAFVSNNSFLDAKANDGFRRSVYDEFDYIYAINLKGNARSYGDERQRQSGNVFRDTVKVGISISFFIKTGESKSELNYAEVPDYMKSAEKLNWLAKNSVDTLQFKKITPDSNAVWLNQTNSDFDKLIPLVDDPCSLFDFKLLGPTTGKDDWVYDFDKKHLESKIIFFIDHYNKLIKKYTNKPFDSRSLEIIDKKIKWSYDLFKHLNTKKELNYSEDNIIQSLYRPFVLKYEYFDKIIIERPRQFSKIFSKNQHNKLICFSNPKPNQPFKALASTRIVDLGCMPDSNCIPLWTYDGSAVCNNVTKFAMDFFQAYYHDDKINEDDIFYYVYSMLNDPKYLNKYRFDLQRKMPKIPLAINFQNWSDIGKKLYSLHANFDQVQPYPVKRINSNVRKNNVRLVIKKSENSKFLKIIIDDQTTLEGIPCDVLDYTISSRSAVEFVLEFYKESKNRINPKSSDDPLIRDRFNTYNFADYKEYAIDTLCRVITVSIETINLKAKLKNMPWADQPDWRPKRRRELNTRDSLAQKNKKHTKNSKIKTHNSQQRHNSQKMLF